MSNFLNDDYNNINIVHNHSQMLLMSNAMSIIVISDYDNTKNYDVVASNFRLNWIDRFN
jgi:hypothetical protein